MSDRIELERLANCRQILRYSCRVFHSTSPTSPLLAQMINLSPLGFGPSSDSNPRETSENFGLRTLVSVSLTPFPDIWIKLSFGMTIVTNEIRFSLLFLFLSLFPSSCRAIFKVKRLGMKGINIRECFVNRKF